MHETHAPTLTRSEGTQTVLDQRAIFARVMFLVAVTCGFTAAGAWIGRDFGGMGMIACFVGAIALVFIGRRVLDAGGPLGMGIMFGIGLLLGMAVGPTLALYASLPNGPAILAQAAGATGLFIAGFGAWGYATRRDLAPLARMAFFALLGLIVFGVVLIFVQIPGGALIYSILGLIIFAVYTMWDFQRLRRATQEPQVVAIALSIFLDIFNVFLFMLQLLGSSR